MLCFLITLYLFTFIFNYELEKKEIDKKFLNMLKSITNLERNAPSYTDLITSFYSDTALYRLKNCKDIACINSIADLPEIPQIKNFLIDTFTKKKNTVQYLNINIPKDYKETYEYFCCALFDKDTLYHYVIRTNILAKTYQQKKKQIIKSECHTYAGHTTCGKIPEWKNVEFTDEEKKRISAAVYSKSLNAFKSRYFNEIDKFIAETSQKTDEQSGTDPQEKTIDNLKIVFVQNLKRIVNEELHKRTYPSGYSSLVLNINSNADIKMDVILKDEIQTYCKTNQFPDKIVSDLIKLANFVGKQSAKDLNFADSNNNVYVYDIIGYAIKEDNKIFIVYIKSETKGDLPKRTKKFIQRRCRKFLGITISCSESIIEKDDPLTLEELTKVRNALFAMNMGTIFSKIDLINESTTLLGSTGTIYSPSKIYAAMMQNDGRIKIYDTRTGSVKMYIGKSLDVNFGPYNLQIKANGNFYIVNKTNDKVWSAEIKEQGIAPFKIEISDQGKFYLKDSQGKILYEQ